MPKTYASTYLYSRYPEYEKKLFEFVMKEQVNKNADGFADIKYEIKKRQISNSLIRVFESSNVILINEYSLPRPFKVFTAKDIKFDKKVKAFIDCSGLIYKNDNGVFVSNNIDYIIAYLVSAMNALIYHYNETKIVNNSNISEDGARCFSSLFTHVVDYISKISIMGNARDKCVYLSSMYYLVNILGKDKDDSRTKVIARRISGLSEREEDIINLQLNDNTYTNIKFFVDNIIDVLKLNNLTLDLVVDKWMYLYGYGTVFALEIYPAFASMITDAYVGCYINNQKTIEKIAGRNVVDFIKSILRIGDGTL